MTIDSLLFGLLVVLVVGGGLILVSVAQDHPPVIAVQEEDHIALQVNSSGRLLVKLYCLNDNDEWVPCKLSPSWPSNVKAVFGADARKISPDVSIGDGLLLTIDQSN